MKPMINWHFFPSNKASELFPDGRKIIEQHDQSTDGDGGKDPIHGNLSSRQKHQSELLEDSDATY